MSNFSREITPQKNMYNIYMDYNSTTPIDKDVLDDMNYNYLHEFGNPSSLHNYGYFSKKSIMKSKKQVSHLVGCDEDEIYFTSGGTESNNLAFFGYMEVLLKDSSPIHIITSSIEHPSVLNICHKLNENPRIEVTFLSVGQDGRISLKELEESICKHTKLISIMAVNNIVGTVQNIKDIGKLASRYNIIFHTDAVQAVGKIYINVKELKINMLSLSGHKIMGPKGIGALYVDRNITLLPRLLGGGQERGIRSGTENVPGIVGLGKSCELMNLRMLEYADHFLKLRSLFIRLLKENITGFSILSRTSICIPSTLNVSFEGVKAQNIVDKLNYYGVYVSTCSACKSNDDKESEGLCLPLISYGFTDQIIQGSIRFSFGISNSTDDVKKVIKILSIVLSDLRRVSGIMINRE